MMYVTEGEFETWYPDSPEGTFTKYGWQAQKYLDNFTTTVDGVKKLQIAFPQNEDDAEAVRRCECAVIDALQKVDAIRSANLSAIEMAQSSGIAATSSVRSISAGGESITFGGEESEGDMVKASKSNGALKTYVYGIMESYLRGVKDDNGVNLMFGGVYPEAL